MGKLLVGVVVLVVELGGLELSGRSAADRGQAANVCGEAAAQVRAYHAPGQTLPLEAEVRTRLAAERRPVQPIGWSYDPRPSGGTCSVTYRATVGNADHRYTWTYDPQTGRVAALDDATRRLSGW